MKISLPQLLWYGNSLLEIDLPDQWEVEYCPMRGASRPEITRKQAKAAILRPIAADPIREMARGKKKAVIIFDDMTRPTRTYELAPVVLKELQAGGIREEDITFVCALGCHGALTQHEFRKKLGEDILRRYRVFNHNPYENCVEVGTTRFGTKVMINREVVDADLRIAIGCVTAHPHAGFSGGGKIVLPGVAHIDTITHHHVDVEAQAPETMGLGNFDNNIFRFNIEEAARMAGLDFKVDVLFNGRGAATDVFSGEFLASHAQAVAAAKDVYAVDPEPAGKQLVIANAFAKANEMALAVQVGGRALGENGGTIVVIANSPEGQVPHYLVGRFGQDYGGRLYPVAAVPSHIKIIIQSPQWDKTVADWFSNPESITFTRSWAETLDILEKKFGPGTKTAVIPQATMIYYTPSGASRK